MSGTPVNTEYRMGSYEGNFKIISKSGETTTDRMVLNSAGDLTFNSAVTIRDLIVTGSQTEVSTVTATAYTVEKLDVVNTTINSPAIMVQQKKSSYDILVASNLNSKVFNIANNGDVNISGIYKRNNRDVIDDTSNYVLSTSNILVDAIKNNKSSQWTTSNNNIYYNTSNVGIGTYNPINKLHLYDDISNTTTLTIQNNNNTALPPDVYISDIAATVTTTGVVRYLNFIYSYAERDYSSKNYTFTIPQTCICDIFLIGGGGAGGFANSTTGGDGGGAGSCIIALNQTLNAGTYTVKVGRGQSFDSVSTKGDDSEIYLNDTNNNISTILYRATGGGKGGGFSGGCGGGNSSGDGGVAVNTNIIAGINVNANTITTTYANLGFNGGTNVTTNFYGTGGGGIGASPLNALGNGGNGLNTISIDGTLKNFKDIFANGGAFGLNNGYIGGGGGGGDTSGAMNGEAASYGGTGGGGNGATYERGWGIINGSDGADKTGGGGGGAGKNGTPGSGGHGYVIIIFKLLNPRFSYTSTIELINGQSYDANNRWKIGNYNGDFKIISSKNGTSNERMVLTSNGDFNINGFNILTKINDTSNYVRDTSNLLVNNAKLNDSNTSNYVRDTSNILVNLINSGSSGSSSQWTTSNNNIYYNTSNVGIGTYNPTTKLHVNGITNSTEYYVNGTPFIKERVSNLSQPIHNIIDKTETYNYVSQAITIPDANLIALYKFDGDTADSNPNTVKYNLTVNLYDITFQDPIIVNPIYSTDYIHGRRYLNGLSIKNYTIPGGVIPSAQNVSVSMWIKPNYEIRNGYYVIDTLVVLKQERNDLYYEATMGIHTTMASTLAELSVNYSFEMESFRIRNEDEEVYYYDAGQWVHIVYVYDFSNGRKKKIYRNGVLIAYDTTNKSQVFSPIGATTITTIKNAHLSSKNSRFGNSDLRDLRIYNIALTNEQIDSLYKSYSSNNFTINFNESNTAIINNGTPINVKGNYNITIENDWSSVTSNQFRLITTPLISNVFTIKYPIPNVSYYTYKKDGFLKYVAGNQTSSLTRDTGAWTIIDYDTLGSSGSSGTSSQWTTSNNNIYYNTSNVGIGTYNPINKLHLYGETTNTTALTIQNNYKNEGIFSSPPATKTGIFGIYKYMSFSYRGDTSGNNSRQTKYTLTILRDIVCDILIVGGGGAGGHINGGGGGAGGVVYAINKTLTMGTYTIYVGRGGTVHNTIGDPKNTGAESSLKNSNGTSYISFVLGAESQELKGRGGGAGSGEQYLMFTNTNNNNNYEFRNINGGSGGGVYEYAFSGLQGGLSTQPNTYWNGSSYIAGGKYGRSTSTTDGNYSQSTGGGGAGSESADFRNGTNGVEINITGIPQFYAAGGGSGITNYDSNIKIVTGISVLNSSTINNIAIGGSSIGGDGSIYSYTTNMYLRYSATNGKDDTGSGGGGTSGPELNNLLFPGNGGSGIVIIKYIYKVSSIELLGGTSGDINVDYSIGNYDSDLKIISSEPETSKEIVNINSSGVVNVNGFVKSSVVAFHAVSSQLGNSVYTVPQNTILTGNYLQGWDIILINNTAWDPTTGIFTVPIKGIYMVLCTCIAMLTQQGFTIKLNVDNTNAILSGKIYGHALYTGTSTAGNSISAQAIINASIGDRISVWSNNVGIVTNMSTLQACSSISIYLIMPT